MTSSLPGLRGLAVDASCHSILAGVSQTPAVEATADEPPYIQTRGLTLKTGEGTVFAGVDLAFQRDRLAAVVGRSGSGRSALLLTLAGRMRGWTGSVQVAGYDAATQTRLLRDRSSVARISDLVDLEPRLTIAESITERALIDGMQIARAGSRFDASCERLGVVFDRAKLVGELSALDQTRLAVALATMRPAEVVFLDEARRGLDAEQFTSLLAGLVRLVDAGTLVVIAVLDTDQLPEGTVCYRLPPRAVEAAEHAERTEQNENDEKA